MLVLRIEGKPAHFRCYARPGVTSVENLIASAEMKRCCVFPFRLRFRNEASFAFATFAILLLLLVVLPLGACSTLRGVLAPVGKATWAQVRSTCSLRPHANARFPRKCFRAHGDKG